MNLRRPFQNAETRGSARSIGYVMNIVDYDWRECGTKLTAAKNFASDILRQEILS
ncbi:MAG: hypothetical protein DHS20C12_00210 [Pseudohongiella sp.]|nr:MAG: hypothetical protein DHS20C12_00210 [Pseudohongiella sp.]